MSDSAHHRIFTFLQYHYLRNAESEEEMADVFEVITAWLALKEWDIEDIIALQQEKRDKRGGFEKRIILEES